MGVGIAVPFVYPHPFIFIGIELLRHEKFVRLKAESARAQADAAHAALHGGVAPAPAKRRAVKR